MVHRTECPVCLQIYHPTNRKPKIIKCGHTCCVNCLGQLCRNQQITCPQCKQRCQVERDVNSFITNYQALDGADDFCQECRDSAGRVTCDSCHHRLCCTCQPSHNCATLLHRHITSHIDDLSRELGRHLTPSERDILVVFYYEAEQQKHEIQQFCEKNSKANEQLRKCLIAKVDATTTQNSQKFKDWLKLKAQKLSSFLQRDSSQPNLSNCIFKINTEVSLIIPKSADIVDPYIISPPTGRPTTKPPDPPGLRPWYARARLVKEVGGSGTADGQFNSPWAITSLPSGNIAVTDWNNHRVQVFTENLQHIRSFGSLGKGKGQFCHPTGIAVDSRGELYIADFNNHRIQVFTEEGRCLRVLRSRTSKTDPSQYHNPVGLAIDSRDVIYVSECEHGRVQVMATNGVLTATLAGVGTGQHHLIAQPNFISTDCHNNVTVSDATGAIYTFDDSGNHRLTMKGGETFLGAAGTARDRWGNLLVADEKGGCVVVLDGQRGERRCTVGSAVAPSENPQQPSGITLSKNGDLLVCDYKNSRIMKYKVPRVPQVAPKPALRR